MPHWNAKNLINAATFNRINTAFNQVSKPYQENKAKNSNDVVEKQQEKHLRNCTWSSLKR